MLVAIPDPVHGLVWDCPGCSTRVTHTPEEFEAIQRAWDTIGSVRQTIEWMTKEIGKLQAEIPQAFHTGRKFQAEHSDDLSDL